jgi:hypothetical protein
MELTNVILIAFAITILIMIYLKFYKKQNDDLQPELKQKQDKWDDSRERGSTLNILGENKENDFPEEITEMIITDEEIQEHNKEFEVPEEEITRIIPDEEINQLSDEQEKELIRIYNYFISKGIKNLTGEDFFNLQENIILDSDSGSSDLYTDIHQIFHITEDRFIAITDLPGSETQAEDQNTQHLKGILGIIKCHKYIGNGRLQQFHEIKVTDLGKDKKEKEQVELVAELFYPETELKISDNLLVYEGEMDISAAETLSRAVEKFSSDYYVYIKGSKVYIRIMRRANLADLNTMIEILTDFHY